MATIYDVAKSSGYSPATVSKALNAYPGVNRKTVKKITETAKKLGYTPSSTARALTTKKTWLVGMLFSEEMATGLRHPHFGEIFSSAQVQLSKAGYDVVIITNTLGREKVSYLEHCRHRGVEGVFVAASAPFTKDVQCIINSGLKMVSVEMIYPGKYSVLSENYNGALLAMEHLYSLGHRKIACISGPMSGMSGPERFRGYLDFLESHNIPFDPNLVVESKEYNISAGHVAATALMEKAKGRFTAVFADFDDIAYALINCLKTHKLRVPEDISVIGFDNLPYSELAGITTVRQEREKIGIMAADILIAQMQGLNIEQDLDIRIPTSLVVRSSCKKIS